MLKLNTMSKVNTMNDNALVLAVKSALPSLGNNVTYNQAANMFLSAGYTSAAGNTYQQGLRLSKYLAVDYSIGHGYYYTFLNGIRIYVWDGNKPKWVGQKLFSCDVWSEEAARREVVKMLENYLRSSCRMLGLGTPTDSQLRQLSETLVGETTRATQLIGCGK